MLSKITTDVFVVVGNLGTSLVHFNVNTQECDSLLFSDRPVDSDGRTQGPPNPEYARLNLCFVAVGPACVKPVEQERGTSAYLSWGLVSDWGTGTIGGSRGGLQAL